MSVDRQVRVVAARELNGSYVGEVFAYTSTEGHPVYGRIAFIEDRTSVVNVTLDGVLHEGSSVVLGLAPEDELWFEPRV